MKTSELTGAALDWAVAKCEGIELIGGRYNRLLVDGHMSRGQEMMAPYKPSTDWAQGGPIIEKEGITVWARRDEWTGENWCAYIQHDEEEFGTTPLIAAMRCYVAIKMGDAVEIPEQLREKK